MVCKENNVVTFLQKKLEAYDCPSNKKKRLKIYDKFGGG